MAGPGEAPPVPDVEPKAAPEAVPEKLDAKDLPALREEIGDPPSAPKADAEPVPAVMPGGPADAAPPSAPDNAPDVTPGTGSALDSARVPEPTTAEKAQTAAARTEFSKEAKAAEDADAATIDAFFEGNTPGEKRLLNFKQSDEQKPEQYEMQYAQAVMSMKRYIYFKYEQLDAQLSQSNKPEDRVKWGEKLAEIKKETTAYKNEIVVPFLANYTKQITEVKKEKIGVKHLWEISMMGNEIFNQMRENKNYGDILKKTMALKMDPDAYEEVYQKMKKHDGAYKETPDDIPVMKLNGVRAIMSAMNESQRKEFVTQMITGKKPDAATILEAVVGSKMLPMPEAEKLVDLAIANGTIDITKNPKAKEEMMAKLIAGQLKTDEGEKNLETNLKEPMFLNQINRILDPKFLGGLLLTVWRSLNLFVTAIAYRKNPKELLGNPFLYLDLGGIFAGTSLMGHPIAEGLLKRAAEGEKNQAEFMLKRAELMAQISRYHQTSSKYFEQGGMVEAIDVIRDQQEKTGKQKNITIDDIIAEMEKPGVAYKNKDAQVAALKKAKTSTDHKDKNEVEIIAQKIQGSPSIKTTDNYLAVAKDTRAVEQSPTNAPKAQAPVSHAPPGAAPAPAPAP